MCSSSYCHLVQLRMVCKYDSKIFDLFEAGGWERCKDTLFCVTVIYIFHNLKITELDLQASLVYPSHLFTSVIQQKVVEFHSPCPTLLQSLSKCCHTPLPHLTPHSKYNTVQDSLNTQWNIIYFFLCVHILYNVWSHKCMKLLQHLLLVLLLYM